MGVYIVKSKHSKWIKIGYHTITKTNPSVYFRYIRNGFYSVIHPSEIHNQLSYDDIELLYHFPDLDLSIEKKIHNLLQYHLSYEHISEWYNIDKLDEILTIIQEDFKGENVMPTDKDLLLANQYHENNKRRTRPLKRLLLCTK